MSNTVDATGIHVATLVELQTAWTAALETIYGSDINLASDTPDGQAMNLYLQAVIDLEDLIVQVFNSMDPDLAIGNVLDQRVTYNGIQRNAGTYTITNISILIGSDCTLVGLNDSDDAYTVEDAQGNKWFLEETQNPTASGTPYVYVFRSAIPGAVLTTINTITIPVTIVLGVTSINNPTTYTTLGINEETDAQLRVRRLQSVSLASQGYLSSLIAALLNVTGVTSATVTENDTDATDSQGIPSHSIWVVVAGTFSDADVAQAIYDKRNAGCGMYNISGDPNYTITQVDGSPFPIYWDVVSDENLYIEFDASSMDGINAPNTAAIIAQLPVLLVPGVYEQVNINDLATLVQEIDPNTLVTNAGFSAAALGPFTNTLVPTASNKKFAVASGRIDITVV